MAKLLYNVTAYENTAEKWATDTRIYPANSLLIASDSGVLKKGDGINAYADLSFIGAKQALTWDDVTEKPSTFAPKIGTTATTAAAGNHDHVVEDITDFPETMPPSAHDHAVEDITDFPETMPPSAHDHAVEADETSGLVAASTIQALAIALSARIKYLEDLASDTGD